MTKGAYHMRVPRRTGTVTLGQEPPIALGVVPHAGIDRRGINLRWLSGTVLTGFCGALLMAGAMGAAIERLDRRAMAPEIVQPPAPRVSSSTERLTNAGKKGDKITALADAFAMSKQVLRVPISIKIGDTETFRVRPHVRVAADLAMTLSGSQDIPAFNPLKLMTGDTAAEAETPAEAAAEAEATVVMRDLASLKLDQNAFVEIPPGDVLLRVKEAALAKAVTDTSFARAQGAPMDQVFDDTNSMAVLKAPTQTATTSRSGERAVQAKAGDTVANLLIEQGVSRDDARAIGNIMAKGGKIVALKEGQTLRTLFAPTPTGKTQPVRIVVTGPNGPEASVALSDQGRYVAVGETVPVRPPKPVDSANEDDEEEDDGTGVRLYASIYETALRQELPRPIIDELIRLYAQDVDFNKRVAPGDRFEVFYVSDDEGDAGRGDILYASITTQGETRRYYRFQAKDDNTIDFYDDKGKSARKFLLRKPIAGGTMRSTFGMRRHPILGYARLHSGVDWADRVGTPIVAAGNGAVLKAGWSSGYGRRVELEHANGYVTTYNHMSGFARGISEGARVRQGQVIGYLGNTGLSTGPHLHYEVLVNDRFVDPLSIRVPRGRELEGRMLADFNTERGRIDQLMNKDPATTKVVAGSRSAP